MFMFINYEVVRMKHEWEKVPDKPGLICKWCNTRMFGGNVTNVCHKRIEAGLREEVEREKKGERK